jgi:hypothetical protein
MDQQSTTILPLDEFDWRLDSTAAVFSAISRAILETQDRFARVNEDYETDLGLAVIEDLLGLAFVAAQAYIAGTISDARKIAKRGASLTKHSLLRIGSATIPDTTTTYLELIDSVANYYKHHDEWSGGDRSGHHQKTVEVLRCMETDEFEPFICIRVAEALHHGTEGAELQTLLSLITGWRQVVIQEAKSVLG